MRRRFLLAIFLALLGCGGMALAADPVEGKDYVVVEPPLPVTDPTKIVVTDFFSYACPHCFAFSPSLRDWEAKLPKDVVLDRVAVTFGRVSTWGLLAKLYYTLRSFGKDHQLDRAVFEALHLEGAPLTSPDRIADWVAAHGLDRRAFLATFDSFTIQAFATSADQLTGRVKLRGVPALLVDGKYLVHIADNGDFAPQLATVDALLARARTERNRAASH
ncbi:MAG TPA: thiol:disulfide interchange protein DsbA/DsbL [Gammaproteobacteria bacterium]|jgi:thiol:disulfide interchange protein DsbA|nr:thiol:disulfide interchange protein DsbA/DsbL [Gammaproteobacteria bacterium]